MYVRSNDGWLGSEEGTEIKADLEMNEVPTLCDHSHKHMVLRGHNKGITRTAQAAVYPHKLCEALVKEITTRSRTLRSEGSVAVVSAEKIGIDIEQKVPTS